MSGAALGAGKPAKTQTTDLPCADKPAEAQATGQTCAPSPAEAQTTDLPCADKPAEAQATGQTCAPSPAEAQATGQTCAPSPTVAQASGAPQGAGNPAKAQTANLSRAANTAATQATAQRCENTAAAPPLNHTALMRAALDEARAALALGEVPVGAVLARDGQILARAHNRRELDADPTAHAELLCLRAGARALGARRLTGCTLYVTLEPCPMCAGAMVLSGLARCYFAAPDPVMGCCESVYALTQEPGFPHRLPCVGGLLEAEARALLDAFFAARRQSIPRRRPYEDQRHCERPG